MRTDKSSIQEIRRRVYIIIQLDFIFFFHSIEVCIHLDSVSVLLVLLHQTYTYIFNKTKVDRRSVWSIMYEYT